MSKNIHFQSILRICGWFQIYYQTTISKPYGCLIVDLKPNRNPDERLKIDILPHEQTGKGVKDPPVKSLPPPPGIPNEKQYGNGESDEEVEDDGDHHRKGYLAWQWLQDSNKDVTPPDGWESYLMSIEDENKRGINNPLALVHLATINAKGQGNVHLFLCSDCGTRSLRAYYLSKCPMCEHVDLFPKLPGEKQTLSCPEDNFIFKTNYNTCLKRIGICLKCKEGFVVDHKGKMSGGMYPEVTLPLQLGFL